MIKLFEQQTDKNIANLRRPQTPFIRYTTKLNKAHLVEGEH